MSCYEENQLHPSQVQCTYKISKVTNRQINFKQNILLGIFFQNQHSCDFKRVSRLCFTNFPPTFIFENSWIQTEIVIFVGCWEVGRQRKTLETQTNWNKQKLVFRLNFYRLMYYWKNCINILILAIMPSSLPFWWL